MNLPTKLTVVRIILSVVIIFLMLFPFHTINIQFPTYMIGEVSVNLNYLISGIIFLIAALTDFFDGHIARKRGLVTNTGKLLDAIADKVLVNSVLIILATQNQIHAIIPVIIVLRDIIVNAIRMEAASKGKVVAAGGGGKIKTIALMVGIVLIFINNLPFELWNIRVADFMLYFATIMSLVSMVEYYNANKKLIFD